MEETNGTNEQRSSIKLIKNTKGYQWEIKIYEELEVLSIEKRDKSILERLEILNKELKEKYGSED